MRTEPDGANMSSVGEAHDKLLGHKPRDMAADVLHTAHACMHGKRADGGHHSDRRHFLLASA